MRMCSEPECQKPVLARGWCSAHYTAWWKKDTTRPRTSEERFWAKVDRSGGQDACWPWQGTDNGVGYGQVRRNGRIEGAHRFAWTLLRGPIPPKLTIDHLCKNPPCCNPAHMEVVTQQVNILRSNSMSARHARVTECPQGHPYDEVNTGYKRSGSRYCKTCNRARMRAYLERRREAQG